MIIIENLHGGRFGNKILHYNNLAQIAKELDIPHYIPVHSDYDILTSNEIYKHDNLYSTNLLVKMYNKVYLDKNKLINDKDNYLIELSEKVKQGYILILEPCLGELFFIFNNSTRDIFKNIKYTTNRFELQDKKYASIHFRGTDFHSWNPESILSSEYYLNSIEELLSKIDGFTVHTDDKNLQSYIDVKNYLTNRNLLLPINNFNGDKFAQDFSDILYSNYIISSPSTFAICAGIMGTEKEIIHSKKWVNSRVEKNDGFWI